MLAYHLAHGHRPGESGRVVLQPLVWRRRRRLRPRARRPGHEGSGRDRGRRRGSPGALWLASRARRAQGDRRRRRGARRPPRRQLAVRGAPRQGLRRLRRERGRRGSLRDRGAALLSSLPRREGRLPLHPPRQGPSGPRLGAEPRRQRAPSTCASDLPARRAAAAGGDARRARVPQGHHRAGDRPRQPGRSGRAPSPSFARWHPRPPPTWPSRCSA